MAIEFSVEQHDFTHALKPFFAGTPRRRSAALDYVDIRGEESEVELVSTGVSSSVQAEVASSGCARLPFARFEALFRRPEKLAWSSAGKILIRIEDGQICAGPTTICDPDISIRTAGSRAADLPIDAPLYEALALTLRFSEREIRDSGLWDRVEAAQDEARQRIKRAARILGPLNVTEEVLRAFIWDHIAKPSERLRL
jgi:hypothetical protein